MGSLRGVIAFFYRKIYIIHYGNDNEKAYGVSLMFDDTITAISTPMGEGGIAVIRVSGPQSIEMVERIFASKKNYLRFPAIRFIMGTLKIPSTET
jgi:hypothetical protein